MKDAAYMIKNKSEKKYKAIIIDEAQDFGMPEYRLLRSLIVEKENDLFIVGDIRQKIYSTNINFSKCKINILGNRTRQLTTNYRNTFEIGQFADNIIRNVEFDDLDETVLKDKRANAIIKGEEPIINIFVSKENEAEYISNEIKNLVQSGLNYNEIVIVARTNGYLKNLMSLLKNEGISSTHLEDISAVSNKKIYYGTMHSIKGFEFKVVFVVGANSKLIPLKSQLQRLEIERQKVEFLKLERSLLYVAVTRARDRLYICGNPDLSDWILSKNE